MINLFMISLFILFPYHEQITLKRQWKFSKIYALPRVHNYTKCSSLIKKILVFSFAISSIRCVKPLLLNRPKITSYPGYALRISAAPSTFSFSKKYTGASTGLTLHQSLYHRHNHSTNKNRYGTEQTEFLLVCIHLQICPYRCPHMQMPRIFQ